MFSMRLPFRNKINFELTGNCVLCKYEPAETRYKPTGQMYPGTSGACNRCAERAVRQSGATDTNRSKSLKTIEERALLIF